MASGVEAPLKSIYHIPHQQTPLTNGVSPAVTLTVRLIMQGKEVGSIIGKKGDNIKKFREESGAKINISDGSSPERIVTVTGCTESILKAFSLVAQKFEDDLQASVTGTNVPKPPVTLRLIVPASQCGSLIGKGGSKIKDIREATGASIQVASDMLPNSTERAVTISGTAEALTKCIYQICCVMMESPPKGATIPYRPKQTVMPLLFSGGQAFALPGQYALPHPDLSKLQHLATLQHASTAPLLPGHTTSPQAWASLAAANSVRNLSRAASVAPTSTSEMSISNELIGCIIGKGGTKINEIRQISGAIVKVSNTEEGSKDRTVTITGSPAAVNCAQYLINASIERHKTLDPKQVPTNAAAVSFAPSLAATPLSPLAAASLGQLMKTTPSPLSLGLAPAFLRGSAAALFAANFKQFQAKNLSYKLRASSVTTGGLKKEDRNKFSPY
ncbi:poly(rC)-binding protein 3-like [Uloborus diversus]|uniref:poly(rC)-binding protein 3-like n=1 Tax=Uloborus diversus TaxID=327109 RepID=UPI002409ACDC|nr:poly(rC)-binding protein 3-like [Uloborus diversus]XP_054710432.1 poly(rC)-binding protein 3-like [Uloborus diversus]